MKKYTILLQTKKQNNKGEKQMKAAKMLTILIMAGCFMLWAGQAAMAGPVGTAFTYQGQLIDAKKAADGLYDFQFKLFDANSDGNQLGLDVNLPEVDVIDGYFTVELDFGGVFDGNECWLEIGVRPGDLEDPYLYTVLSPRQAITPTPYALYAKTAGGGGGSLWQVTDSNIYYNDGNVGIGTTSPAAKLEVNGAIKTAEICEMSGGDTWTAKESNRMWGGVAMSADGTKRTAVAANDRIYVSTNSGNTWSPRESGRTWGGVAMSADGTKQTAVVDNGQVYVSTDSGNTWTAKESNRTWGGVAMSANGTKQTAVVYAGQVYVSTDSGNTWTAKESNRTWTSVAMSADGTKQTAVAYKLPMGQGKIYVSTDSGNTWTAKESDRPWTSVAMSADGTKQTAVAVNDRIYVSTDSGNTWTAKESDRIWESVAMSADGTKQTAVAANDRIYVSTDSGNTWTAKESNRRWGSVAMSADGTKQTAVVWNGQIYSCIFGGVGIGTTNPTEKLEVSGNIKVSSRDAGIIFNDGSKQETASKVIKYIYTVEADYLVPGNYSYEGACSCNEGDIAVGGGWDAVRNEQPGVHDRDVHVYYDAPYGNGWGVGFRNDTDYWYLLRVYAICVKFVGVE